MTEVIEATEVETVEEPSTEVVTYRPQFVMSPKEAAAQADQIREAVAAVLKEDVDYGKIPGAGEKPVLLKPGAEWLLKWFGFGSEVEEKRLDTDEDGKPYGVTYRARVTKPLADGRLVTVSTCEGYAGYDERKFDNGRYKAPWNTIIKMAQKRAIVGACLLATGTSGLFTQDLEDYHHEHPLSQQGASGGPSGQASSSGAVSPANKDAEPTAGQLKFFHSLMSQYSVKEDLYRAALQEGYNVNSVKDLTRGQLSSLLDFLKEETNLDGFIQKGMQRLEQDS